jgi:ligand-binding sensor domain-containing protein
MKHLLTTILVCIIFALVVLHCSKNPSSVAGGTDIGNPGTVAGVLVDTTGKPQANVTARLLPADFNPVLDTGTSLRHVDTTDAAGRYEFRGLPAGVYTLTSVNVVSGAGLLIDSVRLGDKQGINLHTDTLRPTTSLKVTIPDSLFSANSYLFVPGTQLSVAVNAPGTVDLGLVPANAARISYYSAAADSVVATQQQLVVTRDTIPFEVSTELITSVIAGKSPVFTDVSVDSTGNVWCAAGPDGAYRFTGIQWNTNTFLDSVNQPLLQCNHLTVTPSNQVWVCDSASACSFDGTTWFFHGLPSHRISDMASDPAGNVWFAAGDSIFMWVNRTGPDSFVVKYQGASGIRRVVFQNSGTMWFSCDSGLIEVSGNNATLVRGSVQNASGQTFTDLAPVGLDQTGALIVASQTATDGAWRYDGVSWTSFGPADQGFVPTGAAADAGGAVWCSTHSGVFRIKGADWQRYPPQGYPATWNGNAVAIDKTGNIWFAGVGGAVRFDGVLWTVFTRQ